MKLIKMCHYIMPRVFNENCAVNKLTLNFSLMFFDYFSWTLTFYRQKFKSLSSLSIVKLSLFKVSFTNGVRQSVFHVHKLTQMSHNFQWTKLSASY